MTDFRSSMLEIIRGDIPDGLLFVPRLDIWYNRNKSRGSLPPGYENLSLIDISSKLGVGYHSVIPDFIRSVPLEDLYHRALGVYNNPDFPYRVDFSSIDFTVEKRENELKVTYYTSKGEITTRINFGPELFDSGSTIPEILEPAIKSKEDYYRLTEIFSKIKIYSTPEKYRIYHDRIGEAGIAVAFLSLACGPMQHIMRDLRKYDEFCFDIYDNPSELDMCAEPLGAIYEEMINSVSDTNAEVVLFGANYDETITYRPFFEKYIAPWLNRAADKIHSYGMSLLTHTDGENQGLLGSFKECRFDIADSICPAPMTKVPFEEYRDFFRDRATIWGGIPSLLLLKSHCSEMEFRDFIHKIIEKGKPYDRLILGIADTTPPDAEFNRIKYIVEQCSKINI